MLRFTVVHVIYGTVVERTLHAQAALHGRQRHLWDGHRAGPARSGCSSRSSPPSPGRSSRGLVRSCCSSWSSTSSTGWSSSGPLLPSLATPVLTRARVLLFGSVDELFALAGHVPAARARVLPSGSVDALRFATRLPASRHGRRVGHRGGPARSCCSSRSSTSSMGRSSSGP